MNVKIEEFNSRLSVNVKEFLTRVIELTDEFVERNDYNPSDRLLILLYSCISVTRELNDKIWKIGETYMIDVLTQIRSLENES